MIQLNDFIKNIPDDPGVYFFKDISNKIIYIGKAKNLNKRVRSYFYKNNHAIKNKILVSKIKSVETLVVDNEVEALLTEANMINKHRPRYNIVLKDDKSFPYIVITNEKYPRVEIIREKNLYKNKNTYFGPYTDVNYLRLIVKTLHTLFPIRTCAYEINQHVISEKKIQVCLDYHISKCEGPCEGLVSYKDYNNMIKNVVFFLKGKNNLVKEKILEKINKLSEKRLYEQAAKYRDQLKILDIFSKKQTRVTQKFKNRDIIHISNDNNYAIALVIRIRNGLLVGREKFDLKFADDSIIIDLFSNFLVQYYDLTMDIPSEIIIKNYLSDKIVIEEWLSQKKGKKVKILIPQKGEAKKNLDLCIKNSEMILKGLIIKKIKRKEYVPKTLSELKEVLNLSIIPKRIEAFDNSNLQGTNAVAGMVCFKNGKPYKKEYRKFNIKNVEGIDDFESMREVVFRRYSRQIKENNPLPDLILIDGGKGQLSAAKSSLDKLGLGYISIIGLAKKLEEVYIPGFTDPQSISKTSSSMFLLRRIRDEVHRFSITFHKRKRNQEFLSSRLDAIKGVGKKRIQKIWEKYNNFGHLKKDSIRAIHNKTGIPINIVKKIKSNLK